jgi:hypothetical protein
MSNEPTTPPKGDAGPESANEIKRPHIDARYLVTVIQAFQKGYCAHSIGQPECDHEIALNDLRYLLPAAVADALISLADSACERGWFEVWDNEQLEELTVTKETVK